MLAKVSRLALAIVLLASSSAWAQSSHQTLTVGNTSVGFTLTDPSIQSVFITITGAQGNWLDDGTAATSASNVLVAGSSLTITGRINVANFRIIVPTGSATVVGNFFVGAAPIVERVPFGSATTGTFTTVNTGTLNSGTINNSGSITTASLNVTGNETVGGNLSVTGTISGSFAAPGTSPQCLFNNSGVMASTPYCLSSAVSNTTLTAGVGAGATVFPVTSSAGFPNTPFVIVIGSEQVTVTDDSTLNWTVIRGINGTTPAAYSASQALGTTNSGLTVGGVGQMYTMTLTGGQDGGGDDGFIIDGGAGNFAGTLIGKPQLYLTAFGWNAGLTAAPATLTLNPYTASSPNAATFFLNAGALTTDASTDISGIAGVSSTTSNGGGLNIGAGNADSSGTGGQLGLRGGNSGTGTGGNAVVGGGSGATGGIMEFSGGDGSSTGGLLYMRGGCSGTTACAGGGTVGGNVQIDGPGATIGSPGSQNNSIFMTSTGTHHNFDGSHDLYIDKLGGGGKKPLCIDNSGKVYAGTNAAGVISCP